MSQRELVDAYVEGRISRRVFIRRLVATGVALSAAATYAAALGTEPAAGSRSFAECKEKFLRDGDKEKFQKCLERLQRARAQCKEKFVRDGDKENFQKCLAKLGEVPTF